MNVVRQLLVTDSDIIDPLLYLVLHSFDWGTVGLTQRGNPQLRVAPQVEITKLLPYRNSGSSYDNRWPREYAVCDLNLSKWRSLIRIHKIEGDAEDVIRKCIDGFHQGIPDHTLGNQRWFTPKNHESAILASEKIRNTLDKEKRAKRIFGPFTHEEVFQKIGFFRSSPMGSVINGDGSFRIINDLSFPHDDEDTPSVNSFVDKEDYATTWDDFKIVAMFFRDNKGDYLLALFDWEKAYRQIAIHPSQWRYLFLMDLSNRLWLDTRIQFGGVAGCGVFGRPADLWKKIIVTVFKLIKAFRWVDDNLLVKEIDNPTSIHDIIKLSSEMGVTSNAEKVHDFAEEQRYIGFIWNAKERTVRLPEDKFKQRFQEIEEFLGPEASFNLKRVEKFVGRLLHTTYIVPHLRCYMASLHRWKQEWKVPSALRKIPSDVKDDLDEWRVAMTNFTPRRIIPDQIPVNLNWVGDASLTGIGILVGSKWAQFDLLEGWNQLSEAGVKRNIAWAESVTIRLGLLMVDTFTDTGGKSFLVLTDNTTSQAVVDNKKSRDRAVNDEWKMIHKLLERLHCDIVAQRVNTDDNLADLLSRGKDRRSMGNMVVVDIPEDLKLFVRQVI